MQYNALWPICQGLFDNRYIYRIWCRQNGILCYNGVDMNGCFDNFDE